MAAVNIRERYQMYPMAANSSRTMTAEHLFGFLAVTAGNLTVVDGKGVTLINAVPVTAGAFLPIPGLFPSYQPSSQYATLTLTNGASGTLFV